MLADALARAKTPADQVHNVIHGTTLVTNAIIERKGAHTALLTTRGFRDAYEIAREHRYELYDLFLELPDPLVPRHLRLEVDERIFADGTVSQAPSEDAVAKLVAELRDKGIEAIAICFLHSYANPAHEQLVGAIVGEIAPGVRVSLSSEVLRDSAVRAHEHHRRQRVCQGLVETYLNRLVRRLRKLGIPGGICSDAVVGRISTVETAGGSLCACSSRGQRRRAGQRLLRSQAGVHNLMASIWAEPPKLCVIEDGQPLTRPSSRSIASTASERAAACRSRCRWSI